MTKLYRKLKNGFNRAKSKWKKMAYMNLYYPIKRLKMALLQVTNRLITEAKNPRFEDYFSEGIS